MRINQRVIISWQRKLLAMLLASIIMFFATGTCFAGEVISIKIGENLIKVGDTSDQVITMLKPGDMVNQTVEKDPNNAASLLVIKNYQVKGKKFTLYFARVQDPGPYQVIKIIED